MKVQKAKGYRGSWYADVGDERLPCVHDCYRTRSGDDYFDRFSGIGWAYWEDFVGAIRAKGRAIVADDEVVGEGPRRFEKRFKRRGYIGVFEVADVSADAEGLRFRFVRQLADLGS